MIKTVILFLFLSLPGFSQDQYGVPPIAQKKDGLVIWVTARVIAETVKGGKFKSEDLNMLPRNSVDQIMRDLEFIEQLKAKNPEKLDPTARCSGSFTGIHFTHEPPVSHFKELVRDAPAIYAAEIIAINNGFFMGIASRVLTLKVLQEIKAAREWKVEETIYLNYPNAMFNIGDTSFCTDAGYSYEPIIGKRVLMFPFTPAFDIDRLFYHLQSDKIFLEDAKGRALVPDGLLLNESLRGIESFSQLLDRTRNMATPRKKEAQEQIK